MIRFWFLFIIGLINLCIGIIILFYPEVTMYGQFLCALNIGSGINLMYQSGAWTVK